MTAITAQCCSSLMQGRPVVVMMYLIEPCSKVAKLSRGPRFEPSILHTAHVQVAPIVPVYEQELAGKWPLACRRTVFLPDGRRCVVHFPVVLNH